MTSKHIDLSIRLVWGIGPGGGGSFADAIAHGAGRSDIALGDVNADGALDLVVAHGDIKVLLNTGDGTFEEQAIDTVGLDPSSIDLGDLNGDGTLDLAVASASSYEVSILPNDCSLACAADLNGVATSASPI